jgi:hypothetical protein
MQPLASWIEDFFARITFMQDWLLNGPRPSYWLSGFFFPQVPHCSIIPTFRHTRALINDAT